MPQLECAASFFPIVWGPRFWPGNSPDLNPVEHVWPHLKDPVLVEPWPRNWVELTARIKEAWAAVTFDHLSNLSESFVFRIAEAVANNGDYTSY